MQPLKIAQLLLAVGLLGIAAAQSPQSAFEWRLPKGFPKPIVPADNPMTNAKVSLGRHLFYDPRISFNGKASCATCHKQELAFTDGKTVSLGTTGQRHPRNAMSLVNVAYDSSLTWSDPSLIKLEDQALVPMFGTQPLELGLRKGDGFLARLRQIPKYRQMFGTAFPGQPDPFTVPNVAKAIACFERTIVSANSPYDRYHYAGDDHAVSDSAKRGEELFFSEQCACFHCHGGFDFSDATESERTGHRSTEYHNNGLYNLSGPYSYPSPSRGIFDHTGQTGDVGKFKAPTLRNIAVTGPYMHDGSITMLKGVLDHYAAGGRTITAGSNAGNGSQNPNKDRRIGGFQLTAQAKADLLAFLQSLTDTELLHNPRFANPWIGESGQ